MAVFFQLQTELTTESTDVFMQTTLNPGESCSLKRPITPWKRGQFGLVLEGAGSRFPFGFLQRTIRSDLQSTVTVWPERVAYTFMDFAGGQRVVSGQPKKLPGQGSDLLNIRAYEPGDSPRLVHWKTTARKGQLMIRQLAREGESGYHLYVDPDVAVWTDESFEQLCSLVRSLAEDLFRRGQLETVKLGGALIAVRTLNDLHALLDALASFERGEQAPELPAKQVTNCLTFRPVGNDSVAIYLEGTHAGQTNG